MPKRDEAKTTSVQDAFSKLRTLLNEYLSKRVALATVGSATLSKLNYNLHRLNLRTLKISLKILRSKLESRQIYNAETHATESALSSPENFDEMQTAIAVLKTELKTATPDDFRTVYLSYMTTHLRPLESVGSPESEAYSKETMALHQQLHTAYNTEDFQRVAELLQTEGEGLLKPIYENPLWRRLQEFATLIHDIDHPQQYQSEAISPSVSPKKSALKKPKQAGGQQPLDIEIEQQHIQFDQKQYVAIFWPELSTPIRSKEQEPTWRTSTINRDLTIEEAQTLGKLREELVTYFMSNDDKGIRVDTDNIFNRIAVSLKPLEKNQQLYQLRSMMLYSMKEYHQNKRNFKKEGPIVPKAALDIFKAHGIGDVLSEFAANHIDTYSHGKKPESGGPAQRITDNMLGMLIESNSKLSDFLKTEQEPHIYTLRQALCSLTPAVMLSRRFEHIIDYNSERFKAVGPALSDLIAINRSYIKQAEAKTTAYLSQLSIGGEKAKAERQLAELRKDIAATNKDLQQLETMLKRFPGYSATEQKESSSSQSMPAKPYELTEHQQTLKLYYDSIALLKTYDQDASLLAHLCTPQEVAALSADFNKLEDTLRIQSGKTINSSTIKIAYEKCQRMLEKHQLVVELYHKGITLLAEYNKDADLLEWLRTPDMKEPVAENFKKLESIIKQAEEKSTDPLLIQEAYKACREIFDKIQPLVESYRGGNALQQEYIDNIPFLTEFLPSKEKASLDHQFKKLIDILETKRNEEISLFKLQSESSACHQSLQHAIKNAKTAQASQEQKTLEKNIRINSKAFIAQLIGKEATMHLMKTYKGALLERCLNLLNRSSSLSFEQIKEVLNVVQMIALLEDAQFWGLFSSGSTPTAIGELFTATINEDKFSNLKMLCFNTKDPITLERLAEKTIFNSDQGEHKASGESINRTEKIKQIEAVLCKLESPPTQEQKIGLDK